MSTTALPSQPTRRAGTADDEGATRQAPRGWAAAGLLAGLTGVVGIGASMRVDAVYDPAAAGDAAAITRELAGATPALLVFHTATLLSVVLLLVFAAGLRRRLRARLPEHSLLPDVAAAGLLLVSVAGLMGTALDTEFIFGVQQPDLIVPETAAVFGHWVATVGWLWVGAGVAGVAVASAALRARAVPRWIGWVGLVLGGVTLLLGVSPLQYMAGMSGPVWLVVTALGFLAGDRVFRATGR